MVELNGHKGLFQTKWFYDLYQDTEPQTLRAFQLVTSWNRSFKWVLPVHETYFRFKFCCALAHGDGPSVFCNSQIQGTFQEYVSTTFQLSPGTHGLLLVLAVCPWCAGEHQRVKKKQGECGLTEQHSQSHLYNICRKYRKNGNTNLAVKYLRQNHENGVGAYKQLEYEDYYYISFLLLTFPIQWSCKNLLVGRAWVLKPLLSDSWYRFHLEFSNKR